MKIPNVFLMALALVFTACNNAGKRADAPADQETVSITHDHGTTSVPVNPQRIVVLHFASLENLGLVDANVVGMPKQAVPQYLREYENNEEIANVGSLVEVNLEAINELQPDLIIAGYRLADSYDALSRIAPTVVAAMDTQDPVGALRRDLDDLGKIFEAEEIYDEAYSALEEKISETKSKISQTNEKALVVLHNNGRFSAYGSGSRFGLVHDLLGIEEAADGLEAHLHGTRVSSEFIQQTNPDILFIVDRSAAIGEQPLDKSEVENELIQRTKAYENGKIVYLNPEAWYLSGTGGLTSINIMIDEVTAVYEEE